MVKVFGIPKHPFAFGVTVMVAIIADVPEFVVVKLGILPLPVAAKLIEGLSFVQSRVVPEIFPVKEMMPIAAPWHLTRFGIAFTIGFGLTVMVNVLDNPEQPLAVGVTVTVAITGVIPAFMAVKEGMVSLPEAAIPMLGVLLDTQLYVVPETFPVKSIELLASPAQRTTFGVAFTSGFEFTDTTTSNGEPAQPLNDGVTVYIAVCTLLVGLVRVPVIVAAFVPAFPPVKPPFTTGLVQV